MRLVRVWLEGNKQKTLESKNNKMKNNHITLVGNICGKIRLLKESDPEKKIMEKIEIILIPNDAWDARGKPNSLRLHMYGDKATEFREAVDNGDKVAIEGHMRRITTKERDADGVPTGNVKYSTEIVMESYELLRKGSTGYYGAKKRELEISAPEEVSD